MPSAQCFDSPFSALWHWFLISSVTGHSHSHVSGLKPYYEKTRKVVCIQIQCNIYLVTLLVSSKLSLNWMLLSSKLKNGLCKIVTKSQVVTKFNVTKSRLHCIYHTYIGRIEVIQWLQKCWIEVIQYGRVINRTIKCSAVLDWIICHRRFITMPCWNEGSVNHPSLLINLKLKGHLHRYKLHQIF